MKKLLTALVFSVAMVLVGCEDPGQEVFEDFERVAGESADVDAPLEIDDSDEKISDAADVDAPL